MKSFFSGAATQKKGIVFKEITDEPADESFSRTADQQDTEYKPQHKKERQNNLDELNSNSNASAQPEQDRDVSDASFTKSERPAKSKSLPETPTKLTYKPNEIISMNSPFLYQQRQLSNAERFLKGKDYHMAAEIYERLLEKIPSKMIRNKLATNLRDIEQMRDAHSEAEMSTDNVGAQQPKEKEGGMDSSLANQIVQHIAQSAMEVREAVYQAKQIEVSAKEMFAQSRDTPQSPEAQENQEETDDSSSNSPANQDKTPQGSEKVSTDSPANQDKTPQGSEKVSTDSPANQDKTPQGSEKVSTTKVAETAEATEIVEGEKGKKREEGKESAGEDIQEQPEKNIIDSGGIPQSSTQEEVKSKAHTTEPTQLSQDISSEESRSPNLSESPEREFHTEAKETGQQDIKTPEVPVDRSSVDAASAEPEPTPIAPVVSTETETEEGESTLSKMSQARGSQMEARAKMGKADRPATGDINEDVAGSDAETEIEEEETPPPQTVHGVFDLKTPEIEDSAFLSLTYDFTKIPPDFRLSKDNQLFEYSYYKYKPMLIKAHKFIRSKQIEKALNYYKTINDQEIPEELRGMIQKNMDDINDFIIKYFS